MRADLHTHSSASDGRLRPAELVAAAHRAGLDAIAITDHDCVDGIDEALGAAKALPAFLIIPGVEISTDVYKGEIHILGLFIDHHDQRLLATLARLRNSRLLRAKKMVTKLDSLGMPLEWDRVLEFAGEGAIGRPHIAQAMLERGYIGSLKEAFDKYISRNGPAYVEREKITPPQTVRLIAEANGLPVLAHPADIKNLEQLISELRQFGLIGMEVYYGGYDTKTIESLASLCAKFKLIACGGSDYHGLDESSDFPLGGMEIPAQSVQELISLAKERTSRSRGSTQPHTN